MLLAIVVGDEQAEDVDKSEAELRRHPAMVAELIELLEYLAQRTTHSTIQWLHRSRLPLRVHGTYRLQEIMAAFSAFTNKGRLYVPREGVYFNEESRCNLLFVTLQKDEEDYSPTTMYADYALGPDRFHWQSQSGTRPTDKKGRRHLRHAAENITPLLFVREHQKDDRGQRAPYTVLGPVRLISAAGEKPMNIEWSLEIPMPAETLKFAKVIG